MLDLFQCGYYLQPLFSSFPLHRRVNYLTFVAYFREKSTLSRALREICSRRTSAYACRYFVSRQPETILERALSYELNFHILFPPRNILALTCRSWHRCRRRLIEAIFCAFLYITCSSAQLPPLILPSLCSLQPHFNSLIPNSKILHILLTYVNAN